MRLPVGRERSHIHRLPYMRGGLEYLYENLIVRTITQEDEDYSDARITNMMALPKRDLDEGELKEI